MMGGRVVLILIGLVAFGSMAIWAVSALRSLKRGGSGLPYLNLPSPLPDAIRRDPVVCLGHTDLDQPPVTGNGGLWMSASTAVFHSAAGTLTMPRPLRFAESTTSIPELGLSEPQPMLSIGFTSASGQPVVAAFRTPDATGWAIALRS